MLFLWVCVRPRGRLNWTYRCECISAIRYARRCIFLFCAQRRIVSFCTHWRTSLKPDHIFLASLFGITRLREHCLIMRKNRRRTLSQPVTKMTFAYAIVNLPLVCEKCVYFALTVTLHSSIYLLLPPMPRFHILEPRVFSAAILWVCVCAWGSLMERIGEAHLKWHLMLENCFTPHPFLFIGPLLA